MALIKGIVINMGGTDWTVPPLNVRQVRELEPKIASMGGMAPMEQLGVVVEVAAAALSRNYSDITVEKCEDIIDLGNKDAVMKAMLGQSGFAAGEVAAGSQSTGMPSTAA